MYLSFYLILLGFSRYLSVPIPNSSWLSLAGFFLMLAGMMHFTNNQYDVNARIMIMSSTGFMQLILISLLLLKGNEQFGTICTRVLSLICLLSAMYFAFRLLLVSQSVQLDLFMNAGLLHSMVLIVYQVLVVSFSFSIVWMTTTNFELNLRLQASLDPLTQVYNRRALDEIVADKDSSSKLNQVPLSAIMLDIDYFKKLNDGHGHKAGDTVLQKIPESMTQWPVMAEKSLLFYCQIRIESRLSEWQKTSEFSYQMNTLAWIMVQTKPCISALALVWQPEKVRWKIGKMSLKESMLRYIEQNEQGVIR